MSLVLPREKEVEQIFSRILSSPEKRVNGLLKPFTATCVMTAGK